MIKLSDFKNTEIEYSSNNNINSELKETAAYLYIIIEKDKETCHLYTSPSPRDLSTSRMPSSA